MINLLKKQPEVYTMKSTKREVYEQEEFYEVIVEDYAGIVKKKGTEILDEMFESFKNYRLNNFVINSIDSKKYDTTITISDTGRDYIAEIIISKRPIFQRICRCFKRLP